MTRKLQPLIFLGASAFPEISEIVRDINHVEPTYEIAGILDDNSSLHGSSVEGFPVLGPLEQVHQHEDATFVLCIGAYRTRLIRYQVLQRLNLSKERFATLIHPAAKIYSSATVGLGCIIHSGALIFNNSVLEDFVVVYPNTVIGARNLICEGALITSMVTTTSNVIIGSYSHLGTGSSVAESVRIGPGAQVGMGSLVLKDIPPGIFCIGNPLRFLDRAEVPDELLERWKTLEAAGNRTESLNAAQG